MSYHHSHTSHNTPPHFFQCPYAALTLSVCLISVVTQHSTALLPMSLCCTHLVCMSYLRSHTSYNTPLNFFQFPYAALTLSVCLISVVTQHSTALLPMSLCCTLPVCMSYHRSHTSHNTPLHFFQFPYAALSLSVCLITVVIPHTTLHCTSSNVPMLHSPCLYVLSL